MSQKIVPHLWFDKEAVAAAEFYTSIFPDSQITHKSVIKNTPSGDCDIVNFKIFNFDFASISAGPVFKINPSISFIVGCETKEEIDAYWEKLLEDGKALMPLDTYPFSERYGWVMDKYGVTWQLILVTPEGDERPKIVPALMFIGDNYGKAEEAINFYISVFKDGKIGSMNYYEKDQENAKTGDVMYADFKLDNTWLAAMDNAYQHAFNFNEAISLMVNCKDQAEIDYFWKKLSVVPEAEQCGWIKDQYGISWQIIPENMEELMLKNPEKTTKEMLKMKKIIIDDLVKAGEGKEV